MLWNIVMKLNNFLVNPFNIRTLFMLYYGHDVKIIIFYTKTQVAFVMSRNFYSRQNNDFNYSL